jgi:4-aminobutyrate aminotransferase
MYSALRRGLNFKVTMGNILTLTPPLNISQAQFDRAFEILDQSLSDIS